MNRAVEQANITHRWTGAIICGIVIAHESVLRIAWIAIDAHTIIRPSTALQAINSKRSGCNWGYCKLEKKRAHETRKLQTHQGKSTALKVCGMTIGGEQNGSEKAVVRDSQMIHLHPARS